VALSARLELGDGLFPLSSAPPHRRRASGDQGSR
jgi:hypothetical protein